MDPNVGALHESARSRWLGPPKTATSARTITLPSFLVTLLRGHLTWHQHEFVFTTSRGSWIWHSSVTRRVLRPAADGNLHTPEPVNKGGAYPPRADVSRAAA